MNGKNKYFKLLGIPPTSDHKTIKKAYRRKALKVHPDKNKSPEAKAEFIALTEAYEMLTNGSAFNQADTIPVKSAAEVQAEKIRAAHLRYKQMKASEKQKDLLYFQKITSDRTWKVFRYLAYYTAVFSILLTLDFFFTSHQKSIPTPQLYNYIPNTVQYKNELFVVDNTNYWKNQFPPVSLNYSFFFKDVKSINVLNQFRLPTQYQHPSEITLQFDLFNRYQATEFYSYASIYYVFPFFHFCMLIPILLFWFKRPTISFVLGRLVSLWVIFPITLFLTFSNWRIFHLFGLF